MSRFMGLPRALAGWVDQVAAEGGGCLIGGGVAGGGLVFDVGHDAAGSDARSRRGSAL